MKNIYSVFIAILFFQLNMVLSQSNLQFKEEFTDNRNHWDLAENRNVSIKIQEGSLHFEHRRRSGGWALSKKIPLNKEKDFVIAASISKVFGINNHGFGIVYGWSDPMNYHIFLISGNGNYQVGKKSNGKFSYLVKWTDSRFINKWNGKNTLSIKKTGNTTEFFINGNLVSQVPYEFFTGDKIGFFINKNIKINVDKLIVYNKESSDVSEKRTVYRDKNIVYHKVKAGETLYALAKKYETTVETIKEANPETKDKIYAGQILKIIIKDSTTPEPKKSDQAYPPDLFVDNLKFTETSGNNALDALEKGKISFDIINKGRGDANDIEIRILPINSSNNLDYESSGSIKYLPTRKKKLIEIPVSADINVQTLTRKFRIEVSEVHGFDADPAIISFDTEAFRDPELKILQVAIDDNDDTDGQGDSYGNGNSIIEAGESIEVTAFVQNFGKGTAEDVRAKVVLNSNDKNITYPEAGKTLKLGDIESGDYRKIEFYFYTSRRYSEHEIPLIIELEEKRGNFGKRIDLGLKLGERTPNIVDVNVSRIEANDPDVNVKEIEGLVKPSDVDENLPVTSIDGSNMLAVIIGIENYKYAPNVDYANHDAEIFYKYAKEVFHIPERNIYLRTNAEATSGEFSKIFTQNGWLERRIKEGETNILVYYAGHGAPDVKTKMSYLIPYDIDPNYANTGFNIDDIYSSLGRLEAKSVTVFIDACFSGLSRSDEMLLAGTRAVKIKPKYPVLNAENMAIITASEGEQYGSVYKEKYHGLFTYFLLKGMQGKAKGWDNILTIKELFEYVEQNVDETAAYMDKEQTPVLLGKNKNFELIVY